MLLFLWTLACLASHSYIATFFCSIILHSSWLGQHSCNSNGPCVYSTDGGRICSSCQDLGDGGTCSQHTTCYDNEVCYMQQFTTDDGRNISDFGCSIPQVCMTTSGIFVGKRSGGHHTKCYKCCNDTDLCNQGLNCSENSPTQVSALPPECSDITPEVQSDGVYTIYPFGTAERPVLTYCIVDDMNQTWTVIQRRSNGSVNFYRDWNSYKNGFGSPNGEYWLGNEVIHLISSNNHHELFINMSDFDDIQRFAYYKTFHIGDESNGYRLFIGGFTGDTGNDLDIHSGQKFSTYDMDNDADIDGSCAEYYKGAWWFEACHDSDLNGEYLLGKHHNPGHGIIWDSFRGNGYSLRSTTMMIRKAND